MLRYICLSDLHAGARTSLLSDLGGKTQPEADVGATFAAALTEFLGTGADNEVQLILLGDLLDLQFSPRETAAQDAVRFLRPLAEAGVIARKVIATAGNHDHSLWTDARAGLDAMQVETRLSKASFPQATPAFEPSPDAQSRLLNAVLGAAGFAETDFRYPNIGFRKEDRTVVLHHGHFIEDEYALMSHVKDAYSGRARPYLSSEALSAENAGWIDFFWSTTGDALGIGRDAEAFYQRMLTTVGFRHLSDKAAHKIAKKMAGKVPFGGRLDVQEAMRIGAQVALDMSAGAFRDTERMGEVEALSRKGRAGLAGYLTGAVAHLPRPNLAAQEDLTFVFGHTHKPFSERMAIDGYRDAVKVYNTGGWTLNGPRFDTAEGASLVLIDDDLNVASLRLFMTPREGSVPAVHFDMLGDAPAFRDEIETRLGQSTKAWEAFTQAVQAAFEVRQKWLLDLTARVAAE